MRIFEIYDEVSKREILGELTYFKVSEIPWILEKNLIP